MKKIILTAVVFMGITATAQVKIGKTPLTLAADANFQVQADNDVNFYVQKTTGNVGIGTITPSSYQHGGTNVVLQIENPRTAANSQTHLMLSTGSVLPDSAIGSITWALPNSTAGNKGVGILAMTTALNSTAATPAADMQFFTRSITNSNWVRQMTLSSTGDLGIATATPTARLHVVGEFRLDNATEGAGKVLTSDASGNATWQTAAIPTVNNTSTAALAGDAFVAPAGGGVILTSPDGTKKWKISVSNTGVLSTTLTP